MSLGLGWKGRNRHSGRGTLASFLTSTHPRAGMSWSLPAPQLREAPATWAGMDPRYPRLRQPWHGRWGWWALAVPEGLSAGGERAASLLHDCVCRAGLAEAVVPSSSLSCWADGCPLAAPAPGSVPTGPTPEGHWWHPGGTPGYLARRSPGEPGGRSAPICCHKSGLRAARWLPHCWGAPGALQHALAAVARRDQTPGRTPTLQRLTAMVLERPGGQRGQSWAQHPTWVVPAARSWAAWCGLHAVPPSTGQPPALPGSLFGSGSFVLLAHPPPIHHPGNKKVPLIYESPSRHPASHSERQRRIDRCGRATPADGGTDGRTDRPPAPTAGEMGGTACLPPAPCQPSPRSQRCTVTAPRRPRTRALARQTAPATLPTHTGGTEPRHSPPPASPGAAARRGR